MTVHVCDVLSDTPVGAVALLSYGNAVLAVAIGPSPSAALRNIRARFPAVAFRKGRSMAGRQLREYFAGKRLRFDLHVNLDGMTPFFARVLDACSRIPFGATATYASLARAARSPRACRAAGQALKSNPCPIIIPCHRVVASSSLGGYSAYGGLRAKKTLLEFETARR